ncbi:MAG: FAD-dependent oxidoreductase, partial [Sedimentibacter sp.]
MSKKILIIGGVAGGASSAARLRRLDETSDIIMFERGSYISYANCGLPYHIGNVIKERSSLILQTPEAMSKKYNVDVRIDSEIISIDKENKEVQVKKTKTGEVYKESYDTLVISTGSSPLKPPIEGINSPGIFTLWTVPDTDQIKNFIAERKPKNAVVIGGGFIGLEVAENLHLAGLNVTVAEAMDQVMAPVDYEMAQLVQNNMVANNINLILGDGVSKFKSENGMVTITLASGRTLQADMVILSIGVRPNGQLAKEAGLEMNQRGGIVVDKYLKTSDPNIYALGDVIEVEEFINKGKAMIALAGPANKQGRICANNIYGANEEYKGTQGTSVAKVFDLTVASTGANEKTLLRMGMVEGKDYLTATISQKSHAGYYPESAEMILKLVFSADGKKIFGAQIVGEDGVDKRIDTIATTIRLGGNIYDLKELELAYAPPYSSAKDPVNMLGFVAE